MNDIYIVFDTNVVDKSFIIGVFLSKYEAEKFEWEYKTSRSSYPQEYYTEILRYTVPYNILRRQDEVKKTQG